jgi:hypothetical protein
LNESLTVVVPLYNAQEVLERQVIGLLEMLSDLGAPFEVVIVDDGSTDQTIEVAHELAQQYPQLHVVGHHQRLGVPAAVRTGVSAAQGDYVFVDETSPTGSHRLRYLERRPDRLRGFGEGSPPGAAGSRLLQRMRQWGAIERNESRDRATFHQANPSLRRVARPARVMDVMETKKIR